jgi:glycosyltransferase A (GT-A) superfamily protein (DUF2064 family)
MSGSGAAVLLVAAEDLDRPELERVLGSEQAAELQAVLESSAEAWARDLGTAAVERSRAGERLADAVTRMLAVHDGPLLVVWPWLAQFRREDALGALGDLDAGCDVVLGPVIDGGLYLLALARPLPAVFAALEERWQDPDVMTIAFSAARDGGLEVGILRAERALRDAGDVDAALADPLTPQQLRRILQGAGPGRSS